MDVNILFLLLFHFIYNGYGIPQTNNGYRNQTWNEATNDNTCSLIGLNFTGGIEENLQNISSSIFSGTYERAWIGAYAKRVWINFEGCYFGTFKKTDSWMTLVSHRDPAKSCLRHCNYSGFVLPEDKCVCSKDVVSFESGCKAMKCVNTKYRYCGERTTPGITRFHCMCRLSMEINPSYKSDEGDCLAVSYRPQQQQYSARNCINKYMSICYDPNTKQVDLSRGSYDWLQSWSQCYNNNKHFASSTTNVTGIQNGTYWVGTFAVTYKEWGRPRLADYNCVAVNIDRTNNNLTTVVLPCDTLLPALCMNTFILNNYTGVTANCLSPCTYYSDMNTQQLSSIQDISTTAVNILTGGQNKNSVSLVVGSVVGCVVFITLITTVVLFLRHRKALRKSSTGTSLSHSQEEERNQPSVIYSDGMETHTDTLKVNDGVNVYENIKIHKTIGTDTTERGGDAETYRYSERDTTNSRIYSNDAAIYQQELFAEENTGNYYCGLSQPAHDEHEYGQLT